MCEKKEKVALLALKDDDNVNDGDQCAVDAMESELLKAYDARKKCKAPKAKAPKASPKVAAKAAAPKAAPKIDAAPTATAAILKRPATLKRPAAASTAVDMTDAFETLSSCGHLTKGAFTSRAYDSAKRRATQHGMTVEDAKMFARAQFQKAAEMYNQM